MPNYKVSYRDKLRSLRSLLQKKIINMVDPDTIMKFIQFTSKKINFEAWSDTMNLVDPNTVSYN